MISQISFRVPKVWDKLQSKPQLPTISCVASAPGSPEFAPFTLGDWCASENAVPQCGTSLSLSLTQGSPGQDRTGQEWRDRAAGEGQGSLSSTKEQSGTLGVPGRALLTLQREKGSRRGAWREGGHTACLGGSGSDPQICTEARQGVAKTVPQ